MYPVIVLQNNTELPENGTYFVVGSNGMWMHKDTPAYTGFVPVNRISFLKEFESCPLKCKLPPIPVEEVCKIRNFFRKVVEIYKAESIVVVYYNDKTNHYVIHVPDQVVSYGSIVYSRKRPDLEGYLCVGTIHSHCDFSAFHSATDINDENYFDGIHCTFGNNDKDSISITASIVVNGHRESINPEQILCGITKDGLKYRLKEDLSCKEVDDWMKKVTKRDYDKDMLK